MYENIPVVNNEADHSFEMIVEGQRAFIDYRKKGDVYLLVHTEVPDALQGEGIAGALVEKTFKYLGENHLKMIPYCVFIQAYLKKHPEWHSLIAEQH